MRLSDDELRRLRNEIPIADLVPWLGLTYKHRDGYLRFLCPLCSDFHTATNPHTNLARCFRCRRNFNPIDPVVAVERVSFLDAVRRLQPLLHRDPQRP